MPGTPELGGSVEGTGLIPKFVFGVERGPRPSWQLMKIIILSGFLARGRYEREEMKKPL